MLRRGALARITHAHRQHQPTNTTPPGRPALVVWSREEMRMWYIVNKNTGQILDAVLTPLEPDAQEAANIFHCPVFIIRGEHTGQSAEPEVDDA